MTKKQKEQEEAKEFLREMIKPGETIYTIVLSVARSGMSRSIRAYLMREGEPVNISACVAKAIDSPYDEKNAAVRMGGYGMDMGFALAYSLSYKLHGGNYPPSETPEEQREYRYRQNQPSPEGFIPGYSLLHRWM